MDIYRIGGVSLALLGLVSTIPEAAARSHAARAAFQREHPCPSTGKQRGACPGYIVDHIVPLCAGGPDEPRNMQWQTDDDSQVKDRAERKQCHVHRR